MYSATTLEPALPACAGGSTCKWFRARAMATRSLPEAPGVRLPGPGCNRAPNSGGHLRSCSRARTGGHRAERRDPALWAGPRKWTLGGALGESQAVWGQPLPWVQLQLPPAQGTRQQRRRPLSLPEPPVQRTPGPGAPWQLIRAVHCAAAGEREPASAPCQPLFSAQCPPSLTVGARPAT